MTVLSATSFGEFAVFTLVMPSELTLTVKASVANVVPINANSNTELIQTKPCQWDRKPVYVGVVDERKPVLVFCRIVLPRQKFRSSRDDEGQLSQVFGIDWDIPRQLLVIPVSILRRVSISVMDFFYFHPPNPALHR